MEKDRLIVKQTLEIERLRGIVSRNEELKSTMKGMFIGIGMPLNDNNLEFNNKQLGWCSTLLELVEELNSVQGEKDYGIDFDFDEPITKSRQSSVPTPIDEIIDRFPDGQRRYREDPVFNNIINMLSSGESTEYGAINSLINIIYEMKSSYRDYLSKGTD